MTTSIQYPSGAMELLIAMQTPANDHMLGLPVLLWSRPGCGKSSFVESLQQPGFPVATLIGSLHEATDFNGIPIYDAGQLRFAPPEWTTLFDADQQGILFLDELTTAPPSVQAAMLRLTLDRRCGSRQLPPGVRIVAAANPPDETLGAWELSAPLANRFVHVRWDLPGNLLADAFDHGFTAPVLPVVDPAGHRQSLPYWKSLVASLLRSDPALAHTRPADDEFAFASPRSWEYATRLMTSCELLEQAPTPGNQAPEVFCNLLKGTVGSGPATALIQFVRRLSFPDPVNVLLGTESVQFDKLADDEVHVLFGTLTKELSCWLDSPRFSQAARACGTDRGAFLDATFTMLDLVEQLNRCQRLDLVFVPLRQLANGLFFQKAMDVAIELGRLEPFESAIRRVFTSTTLGELIDLLETVP